MTSSRKQISLHCCFGRLFTYIFASGMTSCRKPISGDSLPDADHVLRYIGRKFVDPKDNQIAGNGFLSRPLEKDGGPSVNWMEVFSGDTASQIAEIRKVKRIRYEKRGRVAKLHVGRTKQYLQESATLAIDCIYDPIPAIEGDATTYKPPDPSHAYMKGIPIMDTPESEAVGDLLMHCIVESFPVDPD
jgi:hypothetical protein